uniref:Si:ch73-233f7.3 n=1 Tax=Sinocyclocheilus grahami TaxID=75366 RepID=A0A672SPF2_SINGR
MHLDISESTPAGERFSLNNAVDSDIGSNSIKTYYLGESDHFTIEIQSGRDGSKLADLVLKKALDREEQAVHNLILTAVDGGVPSRSGTANIIVQVLDTNDNAPQFDKDSYTVHLSENSPVGSLVVKLNATDLDEGPNSEITYTFSLYTSEKTQETFSLNAETGEIRVKEMINYEYFKIYDMEIIATDKGSNSLSGKCKLTILITDINDNHPEISIKSFSGPVHHRAEVSENEAQQSGSSVQEQCDQREELDHRGFHSGLQRCLLVQFISSRDQERKAGGQTACAKGSEIHGVQYTEEHRTDRDQRLSCFYSTGEITFIVYILIIFCPCIMTYEAHILR